MAKRDHELLQAIADERRARLAWVEHYRGCWRCYAARRDDEWLKACEGGWTLAKACQGASFALYRLREQRAQPPADTQLALF